MAKNLQQELAPAAQAGNQIYPHIALVAIEYYRANKRPISNQSLLEKINSRFSTNYASNIGFENVKHQTEQALRAWVSAALAEEFRRSIGK